MMVIANDPTNIPDKLTRPQLEAWILFGIMVANKESEQTKRKLDQLFFNMQTELGVWNNNSAFKIIRLIDRKSGALLEHLKRARTGQYKRIERVFREVSIIDTDSDTLTLERLELIHGIGPKTARMICLYALPGRNDIAPLDTHVLKYLRKLGYDAPKSTPPSGPKYRYWESVFIREAEKAKMTVRDFDTYVWKMYATSMKGKS